MDRSFPRRSLGVLAAALLFASAAAAAPHASFTATPVQGDPCLAPCAVHFDAIGDGQNETTDPSYPRAFHSLLFHWDFGDPDSGTWSVSGQSKNAAVGAIAGHLFEHPGAYSVTLTITNPLGETDHVRQEVVVVDPDVWFADADTYCFANTGTPGGAGFEACPTQAASQHIVIGANVAGGFDLALGAGYCDAGDQKRRCLFRAGDTFVSAALASLAIAPGPGLLASFGEGPDPRVLGGLGFVVLRPGWTVTHFDVELSGTYPLFRVGQAMSNVTAAHVKGRGLKAQCLVTETGDAPVHNDLLGIFELDCQNVPGTSLAGFYLRAERALVMGNLVDDAYEGQFVLRTVHFPHSIVEHNRFTRPKNDPADERNVIQIRAWAGNGGMAPIDPTPTPTAFVIIADNELSQDNASMVIRTCQTNDCTDSVLSQNLENLIIERNFFFFTSTTDTVRTAMPRAFWIQGGDVTVRDNVIDLSGIDPTDGNNFDRFVEQATNQPSAPGLNDDRIQVLNNTIYYSDGTDRPFQICASLASGTGHECRNNLVYLPNHAGPVYDDDGNGWLTSNNVNAALNPFVAPVPIHGHSTPADFQLDPASIAVDTGYAFGSEPARSWLDYGLGCRPADGPDADAVAAWDVGAWEFGADASCLSAPEPVTALSSCAAMVALAAVARARRARS